MPKETKFTLALLLFLGVAFGFVVWQRVSKQGDVITALKEKAKNIIGGKEKSPKDEGPLYAGPDKPNQHQHEPRKLPFDNQSTTYVGVDQHGLNHSKHNHDGHGHSQTANRPANPFGDSKGSFVADNPPKDLFAEPVRRNSQTAPKPKENPFSPWTSKPAQNNNPFAQNHNHVQKPVDAFPATQTRNIAAQKKPESGFFNPFETNKREEAPKPNPFAKGHRIHEHTAHNHAHGKFPSREQKKQEQSPFNPFDTNVRQNPHQAGNANLNSNTHTAQNKTPFNPFHSNGNQSTQQKQPVKQASQNSFDPFGQVAVPPGKHNLNLPGNKHQQGHHRHHQNANGGKLPNLPQYTPVESTISTRVYTVQPDESYWSISQKIYGSHRFFQALEEHNRPRITSARRLRPGMKVLVPEEKILLARYTKLIPGAGKSSGSSQSDNTAQGLFFTSSGQPMFRIGEEDTLSQIAYTHLGRTTRWVEIFNLNRDRLKTPDRLKIGTILRLPPDASRIALAPEAAIRR